MTKEWKEMAKAKEHTRTGFVETQKGIKLVKDTFERELSERLSLLRVTAPRFLVTGTGLQDDLAGTQKPVSFRAKFTDKEIEVVHSLAKWKRHTLGKHSFPKGEGIYTDMDAIRKDEDVSDIHSIYVDQWDWELVIGERDRTIPFLKGVVRKIYSAILRTEGKVHKEFPRLKPLLARKIHFVHSEDLEEMYPDKTPSEREYEITKKLGAVFLMGIGHPLKSGKPHDLRASDYDDWSTETVPGKRGLNGDIIVWDCARGKPLEISSMGIRVDRKALIYQLDKSGLLERKEFPFHKGIMDGSIPLTIGGGIGQSRLCQLLLQKKHIGEVQSSAWPKETAEREGML